MKSSLISAKGLGLKIENRWLVRGLDLSISEGDFVAIAGPSGSGKTTLLRTLAGDLSPVEGGVKNHLSCPSQTGMIFQDLQLAEGSSVVNNVLGGCLGRHGFLSTLLRFPKEEREEANQFLTQFGLSDKSNQWASTLSRGEKQRVAACRTLLRRPLLLLADEPVSSLDPTWADTVLDHLKSMAFQRKGGVVCALHNEDQITKFADVVVRLDQKNPSNWRIDSLGAETLV